MIRWKWQYELVGMGGRVTSRLTAEHDDEAIEDVRDRFREFLRGCGYTAQDDVDDAEDRIRIALEYIDTMWNHQATDRSAYRADLANLTAALEGNQEATE